MKFLIFFNIPYHLNIFFILYKTSSISYPFSFNILEYGYLLSVCVLLWTISFTQLFVSFFILSFLTMSVNIISLVFQHIFEVLCFYMAILYEPNNTFFLAIFLFLFLNPYD